MPSPVPARLHVILARDKHYGVVIRRGPSERVCTLGWNLEDDSFQIGQWFNGRIYHFRCDLSPDGRHLIYFAANFRDYPDYPGSWTAISQAPYLKAVGFWPNGATWHGGGGLFIDSHHYWLSDDPYCGDDECRNPPFLERVTDYSNFQDHGGEDRDVYFLRLQRDGWKMGEVSQPRGRHDIYPFEKRVNNHWALRKFFHSTFDQQAGKGCYYDTHELFNPKTAAVIDASEWEWADVDKDRIVWAQAGKLFAGRVRANGLDSQRELYDFNAMTFEPIEAPY